jgi:hypothetical protein
MRLYPILLISLLITACRSSTPVTLSPTTAPPLTTPIPTLTSTQGRIEGQVVEYIQISSEETQGPFPRQATVIVTDWNGKQIASLATDSQGYFTVDLPPGIYTMQPQGVYGFVIPQSVEVSSGIVTEVELAFYPPLT